MRLLHRALLSKLLTMLSIMFGGILSCWPLVERPYSHTASGKDPPFANSFPLSIVVDDAKLPLITRIGRTGEEFHIGSKTIRVSAFGLDIEVW